MLEMLEGMVKVRIMHAGADLLNARQEHSAECACAMAVKIELAQLRHIGSLSKV